MNAVHDFRVNLRYLLKINHYNVVNLLRYRQPRTKYCTRCYAHSSGAFFLVGPPPIQNASSNQILGTPNFGSQNRPLKPPPTYLVMNVPNLQILNMRDMPGISASSIIPFHNVDPKSVHCLSQVQQNWLCGLIFVD